MWGKEQVQSAGNSIPKKSRQSGRDFISTAPRLPDPVAYFEASSVVGVSTSPDGRRSIVVFTDLIAEIAKAFTTMAAFGVSPV